MYFLDEPGHFGVHNAVGTLHGEVAEVFGRTESAREDQGIQVRGLHVLHVLDLAAGDAGGLAEDISRLRAGLSLCVVDHVHLVDIRRHAEDLRSRLVQKVQGQGGLVDLGPIVHTAARQNDTDLCHEIYLLHFVD